MKKLIASVLLGAMLLGGAGSAIAAEVSMADDLVLAEGSRLVLDKEAGYVDKIDGTVTVAALKANFEGGVNVCGKDGVAKADDAAVATDDTVVAGEVSLKTIIYGDVNRDGKVNLGDVSAALKKIAKWDSDINEYASDVDKNEKLNLGDVSKMLKKIAKWDDISLGNVRMVFENKALTAEHEDSTLDLSFTSIMNKIAADQEYDHSERSYKMKLAKNEFESCTVLLWSDVDREGMTAEIAPFVSEYGDATLDGKLEIVMYAPNYSYFDKIDAEHFSFEKVNREGNVIGNGIPEAVIEMADTFEMKAETLQQFVITVESTKDTPAGMYTSTVTFKDADGKEVKTAAVYAYVWDFTVPDAPYSASLFSGWNGNADVYDMMLDYNLSGYTLPYEITDERAEAYMSDPRVTAFVIAGGVTGPNGEYGVDMYGGCMNKTPEQTVANYNKVASNPDWFKKGLFYYTDEPWGNGLDQVKLSYEYVTELLGTTNIRNITPLAGNDGNGSDYCQKNDVDPVAYIDPYISVWCPQSTAFHLWSEGGKWGLRRFVKKYGEFADRAKEFKANGDEMWWYVCCAPEVPYANYFTFYQGVIVRLLSWQQYFNDVDGVLYYRTFGGTISKYQFDIGNGDGVLAYEGKYWRRAGYAPSWRLLQIRDGFDDFDYLRMAEELVGREAVMKVVTKVSSGMLKYTEDYKVLEACRDEIAQMILKNQGK